MDQIVKQCIGIDAAKKDFYVTFSVCNVDRDIEHISSRKFSNNVRGFKAFNKWIGKNYKQSISMQIVIEATGVYHENLVYFLYDFGYDISVVLPKRAKDFSRTLKVKTVTDKIASRYLAIMGLEKKLDSWTKPKKQYAELKHLTREKEQIQNHITQVKNQIHAEEAGYSPNKKTIKRLKAQLKLLSSQRLDILKEIKEVIESDRKLKEKIDKITTIKGVGYLTVATIVGETNGFNQTKNKRQLVSYAGYDIINHQSGTSINTKPRISKRGNRHIRKALHMPALSSIKSDEGNKALFTRIVTRTSIKMKGAVAVQRKLLVLIYTLWKNDTIYDPNYEQKKEGSKTLPYELDHVRS